MSAFGHPFLRQSAGRNSEQNQTVNVYHGVTVSDLQEMFASQHLMLGSFIETRVKEVVAERTAKLLEELGPRLEGADLGQTIQEPRFWGVLADARDSAARTDNPADQANLAALVAEHAAAGGDRMRQSDLETAIAVVPKVDPSALRALTVYNAVGSVSVLNGSINSGLALLAEAMGVLLTGDLPVGDAWTEHLSQLGLVRLSPEMSVNPWSGVLASLHPGYVVDGIAADFYGNRAQLTPLIRSLLEDGNLVEHELKPGHLRFPVAREAELLTSLEQSTLSMADRDRVLSFARESTGLGSATPDNIAALAAAATKHEELRAISEWWDQLPSFMRLTNVGRMLSAATAANADVGGLLPSELKQA